jgi:hypothetical protein
MHHDTPTIPFMRMRRHVPAVPEVEMTHQQQKVEEVKPLVDSNKEVQSLQRWDSHLSLVGARLSQLQKTCFPPTILDLF